MSMLAITRLFGATALSCAFVLVACSGAGAAGAGPGKVCSQDSPASGSSAHTCIQTDVSGADCSSSGATSGPCPSAGLVGCCKTTSAAGNGAYTATCFYDATTAATEQPSCTGSPAPGDTSTWLTTLP